MFNFNFSKFHIFVFIAVIFFCHFDGAGSENNGFNDTDEWKPGYLDAATQNEYPNQKILFGKDGTCGVLNSEGKYVKPTIDFNDRFSMNHKCLADFHRENFGPICGDADYPYAKHCAMVYFFGNKKPENSDVMGNRKDKALALIDGCAICEDAGKGPKDLTLKMALKFTWPEGSLFTGCKEKEMVAGEHNSVNFRKQQTPRLFPDQGYSNINSFGGTFVLPADFQQRICRGMFSDDDPLTSFNNVKLVVTHNCGSGGTFTVDLPELVPKDYPFNIAEMRGLRLDLTKGEAMLLDLSEKKYLSTLKWGNWFLKKEDGDGRSAQENDQ